MTARMRGVTGLAGAVLALAAFSSTAFTSRAFGQAPAAPGDNGPQYKVTTRTERKPVTDVRYEDRKTTVYREEVSTDTRDIERVVQVPVTEYEWQPYWVNRWNPFATPYIAYRLVPRTRLELRSETVRTPYTSSRLIPVERTERVPIITHRMADVQVTERWADSTPSSGLPAAPGSRTADTRSETGGRQLSSDPPPLSTSMEWRPAGGTRGRY
jgi:hypothetical protein